MRASIHIASTALDPTGSHDSRVLMTYEEFASDLPLRRPIVFTSAEEREKTLRRYSINHEVR